MEHWSLCAQKHSEELLDLVPHVCRQLLGGSLLVLGLEINVEAEVGLPMFKTKFEIQLLHIFQGCTFVNRTIPDELLPVNIYPRNGTYTVCDRCGKRNVWKSMKE